MSLRTQPTPMLAAVIGALLVAPQVALPCSPPPDAYWTIDALSPADGGEVDALGGLLVRGDNEWQSGFFAGDPLHLRAEFQVTCDGATVTGTVYPAGFLDEARWVPDAPLPEGGTCIVGLEIVNTEGNDPSRPVDPVSVTYTVRVAAQPPAPAPEVLSAAATTWIFEEMRCVEEASGGSCEACAREVVARRSVHGRLSVQIARPPVPEAAGYLGRLRVARALADVAGTRPGEAFRVWEKDSLTFEVDLGEPAAWPEGQICFAPEWVPSVGAPILGESTCVPVTGDITVPEVPDMGPDSGIDADVEDPSEDSEHSTARDDGCQHTPSGSNTPAPLTLLVFLAGLVLLPRRRLRRTP